MSQSNKIAAVILLFFCTIFSLISLSNHYLFRTYALDLGIFNNALFDYAHFRFNHYSLQKEFWPTPLADHFSIITFLVSPLYWVLGSYTMLIVQIASLLIGGFGIRTYFKEKTDRPFIPEMAMLQFFLIYGLYSALSFDYHDNVVGAMLVPWFLYFFEKNEKKKSIALFLLIILSKENMALWAAFISLGLVFGYLKHKEKRNTAMALCLFSFISFFTIVSFVMPHLGYMNKISNGYTHFTYAALGTNFPQAIQFVFIHPIKTCELLFMNHLPNTRFDGIKMETFTMVFLSGGVALFFYPRYLLMLVPVFAQKLFSDDPLKWGICFHYSIEFAPVLSIALFSLLLDFKKQTRTLRWAGISIFLTAAATTVTTYSRKSVWYEPLQVNFYSPRHYKSNCNIKEVYKVLDSIPKNSSVSASSCLVPHLAFRKSIYQFPDVKDAEYIVLLSQGTAYPFSENDLQAKIMEYKSSPVWEKMYDENKTLVFKKRS